MIFVMFGSMREAGILLSGKGLASCWIVDIWIRDTYGSACFRAEIADALVWQGHGGDTIDGCPDSRTLVVKKPKELVLDDSATQIAAELILYVLRFGKAVLVGEEVIGIEVAVPEILEGEPTIIRFQDGEPPSVAGGK